MAKLVSKTLSWRDIAFRGTKGVKFRERIRIWRVERRRQPVSREAWRMTEGIGKLVADALQSVAPKLIGRNHRP